MGLDQIQVQWLLSAEKHLNTVSEALSIQQALALNFLLNLLFPEAFPDHQEPKTIQMLNSFFLFKIKFFLHSETSLLHFVQC